MLGYQRRLLEVMRSGASAREIDLIDKCEGCTRRAIVGMGVGAALSLGVILNGVVNGVELRNDFELGHANMTRVEYVEKQRELGLKSLLGGVAGFVPVGLCLYGRRRQTRNEIRRYYFEKKLV